MSESVLDAGTQAAIEVDQSKGNFSYPESHKFDAGRGLSPATIDYICDVKDDAAWVRELRHRALKTFESKPMPTHWATEDPNNIDFDIIKQNLILNSCARRKIISVVNIPIRLKE